MKELSYRQIHLDFHTSPFIPDVGAEFDPEAFAGTLKQARVQSINVFAKCHHGMCYYPTKHGTVHPALKFDLLGSMLQVLQREGIQALIYYPVGWEEKVAERTDWLEISRDGVAGRVAPFDAGNYKWRKLCLNKPEYIEYIKCQTMELYDQYAFQGMWYDIVRQDGCVCNDCIRDMKRMGLDPQNPLDVTRHDRLVIRRFQEQMTTLVKERDPEALIFYNGGWVPDGGQEAELSIQHRKRLQTHLEIESLPSEIWGYNHFPLFVNYFNRDDEEIVGMNGKFHTAWGDFGSLRNVEALEYECFRMIASGSKCSIGDQMHPRGRLDPAVYERIGDVYRQIEAREPWCLQSKKAAQIGIIVSNGPLEERFQSDEGVMRMMLELHHCFDFIDRQTDLSRYELLILPDNISCDAELAGKISDYLAQGGRLLATGRSGLNPELTEFAISELGITYEGESEYSPSFVIPEEEMGLELQESVLYEKSQRVRMQEDTRALAQLGQPYFNRTYDRFCSHRHFPFDRLSGTPAVTRNGDAIYISIPLFRDYIEFGHRVCRDIVGKCLAELLPEPLLVTDLPVTAEVTLRTQPGRMVVHMLHYIAERKSRKLDIVDTRLPLYNQTVRVKTRSRPGQVYLAPSMERAAWEWADGYAEIRIPKICGHQMLVLEEAAE